MTTTKNPEKILAVRAYGTSESGEVQYIINRIYTSFADVEKAYNERLVAVYDAPSWNIHQKGNNWTFSYTYIEQPPGTVEVTWWNWRITKISGSFQVNGIITYSYIGGGPADTMLTNPTDGKIYFELDPHAYDANYSRVIQTGVFRISGFQLSFTEYGTFPFSAGTDFAGGYKNPEKPFSITVAPLYVQNLLTQYTLDSAVFYYKKTSAGSYTTVPMAGDTVTIPAGTLEDSTIYDIYFDATDTEGTTIQCGQAQITTADGPAVATPVSPINEVEHGSVTFRWNYSNITGELQQAFDLQTSTDESTWTDVFSHEETEETAATADVITPGTIYWRVRSYNQSDVAGEWSDSVSFLNVVPPQPPTILQIIPGGRIQVRWSSPDQIAYQLQVLQEEATIYDSGTIYGTSTLARVNYYLPDGQYLIRVRVYGSTGLASEWSSMTYQQQTGMPALDYTAEYSEATGGVQIEVLSQGFVKYYLERNGVLVARFTETTYMDRFAAGVPQYRLIAVNANDNFSQAVFMVSVPIGEAKLVTESGEILSVADRWDNMNISNQAEEARYSANEYFGATAPEHTFSKMRAKRITRAFYDPERISEQLLGKVAFYSDEYGNADWVAITTRTRSDSWIGDETTLEMELTTQNEVKTYDD